MNICETLEHIVLQCTGLSETRRRLLRFTSDYVAAHPYISEIVWTYLYSDSGKVVMQFLIDCSVLPMVILAHQKHGTTVHAHLFRITRTWCKSLHRHRLRALGRYAKN